MANVILKKDYKCSDDCIQSGCPGHTAILEFNSISDHYKYDDGQNNIYYFNKAEIQTLIYLLKLLSLSRADTIKFDFENDDN